MVKKFAKKIWNTRNRMMKFQSRIMNPSNMMYAIKGAKLAQAVLNSEKKHYDKYSSSLALRTSGTIIPLSTVAQGTDNNDRVGRSIYVKSIQGKFRIQHNDDTYNDQLVRLIIFYDTEQNGVNPVVDAVTDPDNGLLQTANVLSPRNMSNSARYVVLYDKTCTIGDISSGTGQPSIRFQKFFKKQQVHVNYSGTAAAAGDLDKNNYFLCYIVDTEGTSNYSVLNSYIRIRYYDN